MPSSLWLGSLPKKSSEPLLDSPSTTSVRGALGRQKLQKELATTPGVFSQRIHENAAHRMNPTGLVGGDFATMVRYLERYGGYGKQRTLALLAWMTAQAADHLDQCWR